MFIRQRSVSDTTELVMESVLNDDPPDGEIFLNSGWAIGPCA